jgi:hypothetical protein
MCSPPCFPKGQKISGIFKRQAPRKERIIMNEIGFAFSGILVITGILTLLKTTIINLVMPQIGKIAFQFATAGSYHPDYYHINFSLVNIAAICLVVVGAALGLKFYKTK